jgi:hydrogenase maturation factor HypF (carbamoyltransferase family)
VPVLPGQLSFGFELCGAQPCRYHGPDAVCTRCPGHEWTDGQAFPHRREAKGRTPLRLCEGCDRAVALEDWRDAGHPYSPICAGCIRQFEKGTG